MVAQQRVPLFFLVQTGREPYKATLFCTSRQNHRNILGLNEEIYIVLQGTERSFSLQLLPESRACACKVRASDVHANKINSFWTLNSSISTPSNPKELLLPYSIQKQCLFGYPYAFPTPGASQQLRLVRINTRRPSTIS